MKAALVTSIAALAAMAAVPAATRAQTMRPPAAPPAGDYSIDPAHASLNFRVSHLGLSHYTARFTRFTGKLAFDPAHPAAQAVVATIDAGSLQTNYPEPRKLDFDAQIERQFLDTGKFPTIGFHSTKVELTGPTTARLTGDLTLHGVTRPVTLEVSYNGGYGPGGIDPTGARIGFSAHGAFRRSDFGIGFGLPAPGTQMGVGDEVEVIIEAEFVRPGSPAP